MRSFPICNNVVFRGPRFSFNKLPGDRVETATYSLVLVQITKDSAKLVGHRSKLFAVEYLDTQITEKKTNIGLGKS